MADSSFQSDVRKYVRKVSSLLFCGTSFKKKFMTDLKNDISDYIEAENVNDIQSVYDHFGTPEAVARGFFESADLPAIRRKTNIRKVLIGAVIAIVVVWAIYMTAISIDAHKDVGGYYVTEIVVEDDGSAAGDNSTAEDNGNTASNNAVEAE